MLNLVWVRWCCLDSSSRSYRGTTPSRVRRTTRTACPASSSSSASSRMADGSPRSCKCSRAKPCRWTHSSLPLLMKSSRGRRCTLRMATATSTTTTLPRRQTIAWCHWPRFPGEGFPRVAWATSWAGLYYSRLSQVSASPLWKCQVDAGHLRRRGSLHRPHGLLEFLLLSAQPKFYHKSNFCLDHSEINLSFKGMISWCSSTKATHRLIYWWFDISGDKKILYHRNPIKKKMQASEQMVGCFVEQTN